jgi:hypothetical protein
MYSAPLISKMAPSTLPNWVVQLVTLRRGEANSVPRRGPERAHSRDHQPNQERDRLLHRLLQSGVEARRHGRCQQRQRRQRHHGQPRVHEVVHLEKILVSAAVIVRPVTVGQHHVLEVGVPEPPRRDESVVDNPVLGFVAVGEAGRDAQGAQEDESERGERDLSLAALAVVGRQGRQDLEDEESAGWEHVGELGQNVGHHFL